MIVVPALGLTHPDSPRPTTLLPPRDLINEWEWLGFARVQVVEPATRADRPLNRRETEEILRDARVDIQVAGHIRSADDIEALTAAGASFVVVGSRALDEPDWLMSTAAQFPDLLIVETTARERRVRTRGLVRTLPVDLRDLADELSGTALGGLLINFPNDSPIETTELALIEDLAEQSSFPLLVGGGMPTLATLRDLEFRGVSAVVIDYAWLSESFDGETLARSFTD